MPRLIVTLRSGEERVLDAMAGTSVMQALRDGGVGELLALCGGCCSCATCHVIVDPACADRLQPMSSDENTMLDSLGARDAHSRLSCQILFSDGLDGLRITVAAED